MGFKPLSACFVSLFYNGFHFTVKHLKEWNSGTYFFFINYFSGICLLQLCVYGHLDVQPAKLVSTLYIFLGWWIWVNWMLFEVSYLTWAQDGVALLNWILKKEDWSDLSGVILCCVLGHFFLACAFLNVSTYI